MKLTKQDQDAIDHVASVSENPHAAIIVKQLITGWDVEFIAPSEGIWKTTKLPIWFTDTKYRLIEPKLAKPEYRVYLHKPTNTTCTVDRDLNRKIDEELPPDSEFITGWIEYDQPKK